MPVIGLNLKSINANVNEEKTSGSIDVNSTPRIDNIEKSDRDFIGLKDVLKISFTFETKYEPGVGEIVMKGEVLYQSDEHASILNKWKKDKKLDDQLAFDVINALFRRCLIKVIELSGELRLPPPVQFPILKPAEKKE